MQFIQRTTHYIETPALIKPFALDPQVVELGFELTFEYTDCTLAATIAIDVSHLRGPASKLIFKILSDDVGVTHYSRTTLFSNPKYTPEHVYQNCGEVYQGSKLFDLVGNFRFRIAEEFLDKMFDNVTVFPYHENGPVDVIEYGPERRKGIECLVYGAVMHLAACMPTYQEASKLPKD